MIDEGWIRSRARKLYLTTGEPVEDCEQTLRLCSLMHTDMARIYSKAERMLRRKVIEDQLFVDQADTKQQAFSEETIELLETVLGEEERWIVVMRIIQRRSWNSIAATLNKTAPAVRKNFERCCKRLRSFLES